MPAPPSSWLPGALQYGTDKEKALLAPLEAGWDKLAKKMASAQISANTFHFTAGNFVDIASQSVLSRATGGQLYVYPNCVPDQRDEWSAKLQAEMARNLMRNFGYEGVMRFRCSKGLTVDEYLMGAARDGSLDVDIPGIDADSAFGVTFRHDDKLDDAAPACVQCALLYTTAQGQRRIRVLTLALSVTDAMASLYRYSDLDALLNIQMRKAVLLSAKQNMHQVRESVVTSCVNMLYNYRAKCASSTAAGQLILPESLKLLPLYALSLTKNALLRAGTEIRVDERAALMAQACRMPIGCSVAFIYPRLFKLHELADDVGDPTADSWAPTLPTPQPLMLEKIDSDGAYLIDDATNLYILIGRGVPQQFLEAVLQVRRASRTMPLGPSEPPRASGGRAHPASPAHPAPPPRASTLCPCGFPCSPRSPRAPPPCRALAHARPVLPQVRSMEGIDCSRLRVFSVDNPLSIRVNKLMSAVRSQVGRAVGRVVRLAGAT